MWAIWLAPASYSAHVTTRPDGSKIERRLVRMLCRLFSCVHRRPLVPVPVKARVQHVHQAGAHERQRLVLQVVAHEADRHAVARDRRTRSALRRPCARTRRRSARAWAAGPGRAPAARASTRRPSASARAMTASRPHTCSTRKRSTDARDTSSSPAGQRGVDPGHPPCRGRRPQRPDLRLQHGRRVHEVGEAWPPLLVGEEASRARRPAPSAPTSTPGRWPRRALSWPGLTGNSITRGHRAQLRRGVPMEQATPSGSATSFRKNSPRLAPLMRRTSSPTSQPKVTPW